MRVRVAMIVFICIAFGPARAEFVAAKLTQVPVARLLSNLEKKSKAAPEDASLHASLARVHAMAYAKAAETLEVRDTEDEPWAGYVPAIVPVPSPAPGGKRAHLNAAIAEYRRALELVAKLPAGPDSMFPSSAEVWRLNLAWCLEHAGDKDEARTLYRALFAAGWRREKEKTSAHMSEQFVAGEAATYLIAILDQQRDAAEIARLRSAQKQLQSLPRPITPILVAATADATLEQSVDAHAMVSFDLDGTGARRWGWIRPGAAWLVYAPRGCVTSGLQLFGSVTFWVFWQDGYQALAALDDDGDGLLRGQELSDLRLWRDNGDGVCAEGELERLDGVAEIATRPSARSPALSHPRGLVYDDGRTRPTYDWVTTAP